MNLRTKLRIWMLKNRARALVRAEDQLFERYDCGADMINYITGGRLTRIRAQFLETMAQIRLLDPSAPK